MCKFMLQKNHQTRKYLQTLGKIPKFNKRRAFNKAVGPGKKSKINKPRAYVYSGLQSKQPKKQKRNLDLFMLLPKIDILIQLVFQDFATLHCTEVCFAGFFSSGFITAIVVNPLAKHTSVLWSSVSCSGGGCGKKNSQIRNLVFFLCLVHLLTQNLF